VVQDEVAVRMRESVVTTPRAHPQLARVRVMVTARFQKPN